MRAAATALGALALSVASVAAGAAWERSRPPAERLAGYGCEGAANPLYGHEESDFPRCAVIQRRDLPEPTFSLVAQSDEGSAYVFESRASFSDCMGRARGVDARRFPVIYCEPEAPQPEWGAR